MKFLYWGHYFVVVSRGSGVWHHVKVEWGKETSSWLWLWGVSAAWLKVLWGQ